MRSDRSAPRYLVSVDRSEGQRLGLRVDVGDEEEVFVLEVQPGLVQEWNEANPEQCQAQPVRVTGE